MGRPPRNELEIAVGNYFMTLDRIRRMEERLAKYKRPLDTSPLDVRLEERDRRTLAEYQGHLARFEQEVRKLAGMGVMR